MMIVLKLLVLLTLSTPPAPFTTLIPVGRELRVGDIIPIETR